MAHDSNQERKREPADHDVNERVKTLREKTSQLDNMLDQIQQYLEEARSEVKE
jgi:hypothetical protein